MSAVFGFPLETRHIAPRSFGGFEMPFPRTLGVPGIDYGIFGIYLLTATPYYTLRALRHEEIQHWIGVIPVLAAILIGQSRTTWVTCLFLISLYVIYTITKHVRQWEFISPMVFLATALLIGTPIILFVMNKVYSFLLTTSSYSVRVRLIQYTEAVTTIASNPVFGVGPKNFPRYYSLHFQPHNAFLFAGVNAGIVAVIILIGVFLFALSSPLRIAAIYEREVRTIA
ncbi:MAG: O-antigen ligase family protein, partial [Halobacteriaceae archaeon]